MRLLLDESIPRRLKFSLHSHEVRTVAEMGWAGVKNGALLGLCAEAFDVFVTVDKNLSFQQHLPKFTIAVILMHCKSNRVQDLLQLLPALLDAIPKAPTGQVSHVGTPGATTGIGPS
jgi:hypothetical protein